MTRPSTRDGSRAYVSDSQPEDPAVSRWAAKKPFSRGATRSMVGPSSAAPVPDSAAATPTSAENPEFDDAGSVMP
ncbi:hypothetical protein GCM10029978_077050 [Actinoallomurus acanthiterrae]